MGMPRSDESIVVEGILVASHPGQLRVLIDHVALDFDENDVLDVTVLPSPPHLIERMAQAARVELRGPARVIRVSSADAYDDVIWRRGHLFAVRTRRHESADGFAGNFIELEREFFARYGIAPARWGREP